MNMGNWWTFIAILVVAWSCGRMESKINRIDRKLNKLVAELTPPQKTPARQAPVEQAPAVQEPAAVQAPAPAAQPATQPPAAPTESAFNAYLAQQIKRHSD